LPPPCTAPGYQTVKVGPVSNTTYDIGIYSTYVDGTNYQCTVWGEYSSGAGLGSVKGPTSPPQTVNIKYSIGSMGPAGGKVFYITDDGLHGMEAALIDQATSVWGCDGYSITGAKVTAVGTGAANTAAIVAGCAARTTATIADVYALNGFTDWYLPSKEELKLLYGQRAVMGAFAINAYWSSTETNPTSAFYQNFGAAFPPPATNNKSISFPVRAVRTFGVPGTPTIAYALPCTAAGFMNQGYTAPSGVGFNAITGYYASCVAPGQADAISPVVPPTTLAITVYGTLGVQYSCWVQALNAEGTSPEGAVSLITAP
jgi:hypothetical protein